MAWPTASSFGHRSRAVVSETIATERFDVRSACANARPRTTAISSTLKVSGDTNLYATATFAPLVSANAARDARPVVSGPEAAMAATDGSAVIACTMAVRVDSLAI